MNLRGWRTILSNALAGVIPAWEIIVHLLSVFNSTADQYGLIQHIPPQYMTYYVVAIVAINILLRLDTRTAVGKKY